MSLSKKNLALLKYFQEKEDISKHNNSTNLIKHDYSSKEKANSYISKNPNDIFYSIIDNAKELEDTTLVNPKLKESEEDLFKTKANYNNKNQSSHATEKVNIELSNEDLLYDEFNYLLDE